VAREQRGRGRSGLGVHLAGPVVARVEQQVGNRVGRVGLEPQRRGVIGQQKESPPLPAEPLVEALDQRAQDAPVPVLERRHPLGHVTGVARLVAGFDVDEKPVRAGIE
jgi:hypothetical protein